MANPRRVRLIAENDTKNDSIDAELLARLGRVDPALLKPIVHRGAQAQRDRILIQARDGFVRARTQMVNEVRGFAKAPQLTALGACQCDRLHPTLPARDGTLVGIKPGGS